MITHAVEQGTPEWHNLRLGIPTASKFSQILTPKTLKLSSQADKYALRLLAEWAIGEPAEDVSGPWLDRGTEMEAEARAWYSFSRDAEVRADVFCTTDDGLAGCSPDGLVGEDGTEGGLEIKCRSAANHIDCLLGNRPIADRGQVQGCLWVTGAEWWDVLAYNPHLPKKVERVYPDPDYQAALTDAMQQFHERLDKLKAALLLEGVNPVDPQTIPERIAAAPDEHHDDLWALYRNGHLRLLVEDLTTYGRAA